MAGVMATGSVAAQGFNGADGWFFFRHQIFSADLSPNPIIQNAADLEWPADDPANAGIRDEFRLNPFPPASGTSLTPQPTPQAKPNP